jgi:preprotein translocase subunit SecD
MNKNLGWKVIVIAATLLFFLFGIVGIPDKWSGSGLVEALQNRIHLGLDLKGGTHLILQVQVNDAVNVDSDNAVERLKADMRARKINYAEISKPDPVNNPEKIVLKGVPPESRSDLLSIVQDRLPEYDLTSGTENTWTISM